MATPFTKVDSSTKTTPDPASAPDGSRMTPSMVQAKKDFNKDVASGLVTPSGEVTQKYRDMSKGQ